MPPGTNVNEIANGIYRISTPLPPEVVPGGFTFNQYLVVDDEPLLFHTGPRGIFPLVRDGVATVIPVEQEFRDFLTCGVLAHGFARLRCGDCAFERLVPSSCKRRGFCPTCGGRRMTESAARLVDHVLPHVPIRQWVLSLPYRLRYLLA